jgi:uncharacterized membrane protein
MERQETPSPVENQVSVPYGKGVQVEKSIAVNATPAALYSFWRELENLPRIMSHLRSVTVRDDGRSHWIVRGPAGRDIEWDAEIINEVPGELIGWRSVGSSQVDHAGSVHFEPAAGGGGTLVRVLLRYDPPGGKIGAAFAKLFGEDPSQQIEEDLRHFKELMESGG